MKFTAYALSVVMACSCAQLEVPADPYRRVASLDEDITQASLEELQAQMSDKFTRIELTTLAAYEGLIQFDAHLNEQPGPLESNPHYPGLLAARSLIEDLQHEVLELRDQFYSAAMSPQLSTEQRMKSVLLLKATLPSSQAALDELVFIHLHADFAFFTRQLLMDMARVDNEKVRQELEKLYAELLIHYGPFKEKLDHGSEWKSLTAKARAGLKSHPKWANVRRTYEHLTQEVRADLQAIKNDKQQAIVFQPSAERAGNMVGSEFPAKVWSLTYDDGPGTQTSGKILDNLKRHQLKATFFQLTKNAKALPNVARAVRESGMELASHSYGHRQTPKLTAEQRDWEIRVASSELATLHGKPIKFYRLPYGAGVSNADIRSRIARANMIHVFWSVDTLDWMAQAPSEIVARTLKQMKASSRDAGIILFHDIHERTVIASEEVMRYLKLDQRRVCSLQEIVDAMNAGTSPCPVSAPQISAAP